MKNLNLIYVGIDGEEYTQEININDVLTNTENGIEFVREDAERITNKLDSERLDDDSFYYEKLSVENGFAFVDFLGESFIVELEPIVEEFDGLPQWCY